MCLSSKESSVESPGWLRGLRQDGETLMYIKLEFPGAKHFGSYNFLHSFLQDGPHGDICQLRGMPAGVLFHFGL